MMDNMIINIETQLKELTLSFISYFEKLKENGVITQEEFDKHVEKKNDFLNNVGFEGNQ